MADKDTVAKRRGGLASAWVLPLPDGTIAQGDRQQKVTKYPGILSTAPVIDYPTGSLGGTPSGGTDFVVPRVPRGLPPGATTRLRRGTQHLQNSAWSFLGTNTEAEDDDVLLLRDSSNNNFKRITKENLGISGGFGEGPPGDDGTDSDIRFQYVEVNNGSALNVVHVTSWNPADEALNDPGKMTVWVLNNTAGGTVTYQFGTNNIKEGTTGYSEFTLTNEGDMIYMVTTLWNSLMRWQICEKNGATLA